MLAALLGKVETDYPRRWLAIKLLEKDDEVTRLIEGIDRSIAQVAEDLAEEIERIHGEPSGVVMSAERYKLADEIARKVQKIRTEKETLTDELDKVALHPVLGYLAILGNDRRPSDLDVFHRRSKISKAPGNALSPIEQFEPLVSGPLGEILWNGAFQASSQA